MCEQKLGTGKFNTNQTRQLSACKVRYMRGRLNHHVPCHISLQILIIGSHMSGLGHKSPLETNNKEHW